MRGRRLAMVTAGVLVGWFVLLFVLGIALGSCQERRTRERLAESLQAKVTAGDADLALIRGHLTLDRLAIQRVEPNGHLSIDVREVRCELAPLGWALVDHDCRELAVRGVRFEISTATLFKVQRPPKAKPIRADRIVVDDAVFVFLPNAFAPNLGRIEIAIERAVAGPTVMRTPLSWLFALEELRARFALPAGITVHLGYHAGVLTVSGSVFGAKPVSLPLALPVASAARDAHEEMQLLLSLGTQIAERLVAKRAEDWIRERLKK